MSFDNNLIGIDYLTTVNAYHQRDIEMNINNNESIIKSLKKLGYYNNIDYQQLDIELKKSYIENLFKKINNELSSSWDSSIKNKTINELISYEINPSLLNKMNRTNSLSKFLNETDTFNFYNDLTIGELSYLGY
jgi:hypothetical protein